MKVNVYNGELTQSEINSYINYGMNKYRGRQFEALDIRIDNDYVDLTFHFKDNNFQKTFRSADYLVNSLEKMNDAKQMEFNDKVKHEVR